MGNPTASQLKRFQGAILGCMVGDALGWPTSYTYMHAHRGLQPFYELPVTQFKAWSLHQPDAMPYKELLQSRQIVSERELIAPGACSAEIRLLMAVAHCVQAHGVFAVDNFISYWLHWFFEDVWGGDPTNLFALHYLLENGGCWQEKFYQTALYNYSEASSAGTVIRILPIALANRDNAEQLFTQIWLNAVLTHGHPRAILGALLYGLAVQYFLSLHDVPRRESLLVYLGEQLGQAEKIVAQSDLLTQWVVQRDIDARKPFWQIFFEERRTLLQHLEGNSSTSAHLAYYKLLGARHPVSKSYGVTVVCAALYLVLRYWEQPQQALITAVNTFGSQTSTIGACVGGLLGAFYGVEDARLPLELFASVSNREEALRISNQLYQYSVT